MAAHNGNIQPPDAKDFGLDEKLFKVFHKEAHETYLLPALLGWGSFFLILLFYPPKFVYKNALSWPILILYFVPGLIIGFAINKVRSKLVESRKRNHRCYPNYLQYLDAYALYSETQHEIAEKERKIRVAKDRELKQQVSWWKTLDGVQFERELANLYRARGYDVKYTGGSGDEGVDLILRIGEKRIIVQCKSIKSYVSPGAVRDLYGTLMHQKADEAWLITTSGFYSGARGFARGKPIRLFTIGEILRIPDDKSN
jgi:HJR/Mrr/RecB family endonuclease